MAKRIFDAVCSGVALVVLGPVLFVIGLAIKLDSRGPVFYRGVRIGRFGRPFRVCKFRTMVEKADELGVSSTGDQDARVTRCGRVLRRLKLDELPQLINVLIGEMSLVGPRPEVAKFVDLYTEDEKIILTVRPGITDWASIRFHNEGEIIAASGIEDADEAYAKLIRPEKLQLQRAYVKKAGLWTDIKILFATAVTLVSSRFRKAEAATTLAGESRTPSQQGKGE